MGSEGDPAGCFAVVGDGPRWFGRPRVRPAARVVSVRDVVGSGVGVVACLARCAALPSMLWSHPRAPAYSRSFLQSACLDYSNQDLQRSLARLVRKLAAVRRAGGPRRRPTTCRQRPRCPRWVLKAIVRVLADRDEPMRARDIHTAVEAALGEPVAASSIKTGGHAIRFQDVPQAAAELHRWAG